MNSASVNWSSVLDHSTYPLAATISGTSSSRSTIQASRRPGASDLLAEPKYTTRSGSRPCRAPPGWRPATVVASEANDARLRLGVNAAGPGEIVREDGAQLEPTEGGSVAEGVMRRRGQSASGRGEPLRPGKLRQVGRAWQQSVRG